MGLFSRTPKFKCPVWVVRNGKRKKCGRKFLTIEQMLRHADRAHGGRGREV
jgi:hypothetical protein